MTIHLLTRTGILILTAMFYVHFGEKTEPKFLCHWHKNKPHGADIMLVMKDQTHSLVSEIESTWKVPETIHSWLRDKEPLDLLSSRKKPLVDRMISHESSHFVSLCPNHTQKPSSSARKLQIIRNELIIVMCVEATVAKATINEYFWKSIIRQWKLGRGRHECSPLFQQQR